jgi:hypothetical protein
MFGLRHLIRTSQQSNEERRAEQYRQLIRREAKIGGELFGPVPKNVRREFFCLDEHTWVWHEEWMDSSGKRRTVTTRYDVRPNGILKAQDGQAYRYVDLEEAKRLYEAVQLYDRLTDKEIYAM